NFGFEREEGLHHQASWLYPIRYFQEAGGAPRVIVCSESAAMSCRIRSAAGWPCKLVNRPLLIRACTSNCAQNLSYGFISFLVTEDDAMIPVAKPCCPECDSFSEFLIALPKVSKVGA